MKLPQDIAERDVILLDPMLATGNSTAAAVELVKRAGAQSVAADRADRGAGGNRAHPPRPPGRPDRRRRRRPRPERARLHRPRPRRRGRPAVRDAVERAPGADTMDRAVRHHGEQRRPADDRIGDARHVQGPPGRPLGLPRSRSRVVLVLTPGRRRRRAHPRRRRRARTGEAANPPPRRCRGSAGSRSSSASSSRRSRSCRSTARTAASSSAPPSRRWSASSTTSAAFPGGPSSIGQFAAAAVAVGLRRRARPLHVPVPRRPGAARLALVVGQHPLDRRAHEHGQLRRRHGRPRGRDLRYLRRDVRRDRALARQAGGRGAVGDRRRRLLRLPAPQLLPGADLHGRLGGDAARLHARDRRRSRAC